MIFLFRIFTIPVFFIDLWQFLLNFIDKSLGNHVLSLPFFAYFKDIYFNDKLYCGSWGFLLFCWIHTWNIHISVRKSQYYKRFSRRITIFHWWSFDRSCIECGFCRGSYQHGSWLDSQWGGLSSWYMWRFIDGCGWWFSRQYLGHICQHSFIPKSKFKIENT